MILAIAAAGALSGCKLHYQVDATVKGGTIEFSLPDGPHRACLDSFEIRQRDGDLAWRLGKSVGAPACASSFPVRYGVVPVGLVQIAAPTDLRAGQVYDVKGTGRGSYSGAFKLLPSGEVLNRWTEY